MEQISKNSLTRLAAAVLVMLLTVGLTAGPPGSGSHSPGPGEGAIEVRRCEVKFFQRAELATDRPGIIAEMPLDEGDQVSKGDLVVRLRDEVAQANLKLATERAESRTAVEIAEKEAAAIAVELESAEAANKNAPVPLVPLSTVERLRLTKEAREKAVLRAQEEVSLNERARDQAQAEVESLRIHSKQNGVVTRVLKREGEAVQQGEAVIEIVDPSIARVEGKVHVAEARRIRVGMPVEVRLDFRDQQFPVEDEVFSGTVGFIDVSASPALHEVRLWAEIENRDGILLDGLPAVMTIDVGR